jgi:para-nitrobenzyl esterase
MMYAVRWVHVLPAALVAAGACGNEPAAMTPDSASDAVQPGEVATDRGPVIGHAKAGVTAFLGIPYAEPPVGALRWRAPRPPAAWTEPLDASALGPACEQTEGGLGQTGPYSEDCLTLNVWTPQPAASAGAPVMVFIHGGAWVHGSSNQPTYDGAALAAAGVVVVSMNYRLGAFGFLAHPALTAEDEHGSSGNLGLLDQQLALAWVQANVTGFGGDPDNVTVFGESSGAMSVCAHAVSPLAQGLFRRGLGESGSCVIFSTPLRAPAGSSVASAESLGVAIAAELGCGTAADTLACMRGKTAAEVLAASPGSLDLEGGATLSPNIDGYVLPEAPAAAFAAGRINPLDGFLAGTNRDEATLFTAQTMIASEADYEAAVNRLLPSHADDALALYPAASYATPKDAYNTLITDVLFVCPTRAQLRAMADRGTAAYMYQLTRTTPFGVLSGLGVYHGSELPFVFGNLTARSGMTAADRAFSSQLIGYWTRFATSGAPGGTGAAAWPAYTQASDAHLVLGAPITTGSGLRAATCDVIATWRVAP